MKTAYVLPAFGLALMLMGGVVAAPVAAADLAGLRALDAAYRRDVAPIVEKFCLDCHMDDDPSGTVSFEGIDTPESLFALTKIWLKAAQTQQHKQMPPPKKTKQPDDTQRQVLIAWVKKLDQALSAIEPFDPGPAQVRRLNRHQYERSLRDLFGLENDIADEVGLPDDPRAFGYDSIANALDIPESLFEKYMVAADAILDRAIDTKPMARRWDGKTLEHVLEGTMPEGKSKDGPIPPATTVEGAVRVFRVNADMPLAFEVPQEGTYRIRVRGWGHKGPNWIQWRPDLGIKIGDRIHRSFPMVHTEAMPGEVDALIHLPAGPSHMSLVFTNAVHGPSWAGNKDRFRTLGLEWVEVSGPVARSGAKPDPQAHRRIFFVEAGDKPREAAVQIVREFTGRAFRRPVKPDEVQRLMTIYDQAVARKMNHETAVRHTLKAVLLSPHFLFRIESDATAAQGVHRVSDHELATRLSYFLWGTMPDASLRAVADAGDLRKPEVLRQQMDRLLSDEQSLEIFAYDFAVQWLRLGMLDHALPSEDNFPKFDAKARAGMRREVMMFLQYLIRENRPVHELIDSDYTFTGRALTPIYGFGGHQPEFKQEKIDKRRHPYRGGLLGMGAIHAMNSHVARNMPTRRGSWILDVMLGDPPPPPPANVEQIDEGADKSKARDFRELLTLHADESKTCAGCHRKMDPLGFALDNFNPIGQWETERHGKKIDASSVLPDGRKIDGAIELKKILLEDKDRFVWNLTEQLMIYALGRDVAWHDRPSIARIVEATRADGYRIQTLIRGVVESYPFKNRLPVDAPSRLAAR